MIEKRVVLVAGSTSAIGMAIAERILPIEQLLIFTMHYLTKENSFIIVVKDIKSVLFQLVIQAIRQIEGKQLGAINGLYHGD